MGILMWMTRRSPFQEGEGGNPQNNHFDPLPLYNQIEVGSPGNNLLTPAPTQPDEDVGCLINTLAMGLWLGTPHINTFSSEAMPGKMEVPFKQWYYEVQCIKDHYPESVVRERYQTFSQRGGGRYGQIYGPTTNIADILQKLTVIFGTVASFDVLMQNFYKVSQSNHEKVPSFAMRLKGTLNQIQLQCLGRITDWEVQQYLKDCLFHGACKHNRDSIWYLYSNPWTTILGPPILSSWLLPTKWRTKMRKPKTRWGLGQQWPPNCWGYYWDGKPNSQADGCPDKSRTG